MTKKRARKCPSCITNEAASDTYFRWYLAQKKRLAVAKKLLARAASEKASDELRAELDVFLASK